MSVSYGRTGDHRDGTPTIMEDMIVLPLGFLRDIRSARPAMGNVIHLAEHRRNGTQFMSRFFREHDRWHNQTLAAGLPAVLIQALQSSRR
jgi:hypothetical protein